MATRRTSLGDWLASHVPGPRHWPSPPSADFASALVEHLADGVVACDAAGNIVLMNRRAREGSEGFPAQVEVPPSLTQDRWAEFFQLRRPGSSELLTTDELPLVRALRGEIVRDMRLETYGEDGSRAVINTSGGPGLDADGEIQGALGGVPDHTGGAPGARRAEVGGGRGRP